MPVTSELSELQTVAWGGCLDPLWIGGDVITKDSHAGNPPHPVTFVLKNS